MEIIHNAADACELHWEADKYKEPRLFYHWSAKVHHPTSTESAQQSSTSTLLSTTPSGLLPQTVTMPSTIKKRKSLASSSSNISVQKPPALKVPNKKKLHYGNMVQHQTNTNPMPTPTSQLPDTMSYLATFTTPHNNDQDDVLCRLRTVPNPNPDSDPFFSSSSSSFSSSSDSFVLF